MKQNSNKNRRTELLSTRSIILTACFILVAAGIVFTLFRDQHGALTTKALLDTGKSTSTNQKTLEHEAWKAPDDSTIPLDEHGELIKYGRELIAHTSVYLGPKGSVATIANGMNCQNCHNDAGTKPFGINYSAVSSTYPQFRPRANAIVSIVDRINGCFQRSMNGKALDSTTKEMKAIVAYMEWLGKDVPKGVKPENAGIKKLPYLDIAADPKIGKAVFINHCQICHGADGEGLLNPKGNEYVYPPLWGKDSYNDGAGLYRLTNFAGFVKYNMPLGVTVDHPQLSDEETWHVAAFVNSQPRPHKDQSADWKDISKKPIDMPFGPYVDEFSEEQHKYGPFGPIEKARELKIKNTQS